MRYFYTPDVTKGSYVLPKEESKHCVKVLRMSEGDQMVLLDGKGGKYVVEISLASPKSCVVTVLDFEQENADFPYNLTIAFAPTKNIARVEWASEKITEIGISRVAPLLCEHSERKVIKQDRLSKVVVSAMKQSRKLFYPQVDELISFSSFVESCSSGDRYIAHCYDSVDKMPLKSFSFNDRDVTILVGPEGDFSEKEVEFAKSRGFKEISLGNSRLRTETAVVAAVHTVNLLADI